MTASPSKAERITLSIQAGESGKHILEWTKDDDPPGYGCLGSLEWHAVVLDDFTVDLEVSLQLRTKSGATKRQTPAVRIIYEGGVQSRSFQGMFNAAEDLRLHSEGDDSRQEVGAVVFEFNNTFSWFADKEVVLTLVLNQPPAMFCANVEDLPPVKPQPAVTEMRPTISSQPSLPSPSLPELMQKETPKKISAAARLAEDLAHLLAAAEDMCSALAAGDNYTADLKERIICLRARCVAGPPAVDLSVLVANSSEPKPESSNEKLEDCKLAEGTPTHGDAASEGVVASPKAIELKEDKNEPDTLVLGIVQQNESGTCENGEN
eukprot:gnl/MRDRNA2_/MRDRNA2_95946_c0_seq1.p1 gnl/MRDRNA2_/MRDRNA2_95946_c0~~gnl/MRDRNA2_/MRDRNA2_95946_c0_seq1.p1  ORF type:complete len:321 (-),score=68.37 gnl/MRDRNA2_/MRDRNA2_95946_c0_seq1:16-978(-)